MNKLQTAYYNAFGDDYDSQFYNLMQEVLNRYELDEVSEQDDDTLWQMVDDATIWYDDQWLIARHYHGSPRDVNFDEDCLQLFTDFSLLIEEYHKLK